MKKSVTFAAIAFVAMSGMFAQTNVLSAYNSKYVLNRSTDMPFGKSKQKHKKTDNPMAMPSQSKNIYGVEDENKRKTPQKN